VPLTIEYESLRENYRREVAKVLSFLGLDYSAAERIPEPRLVRQADTITADWRQQMDRISPRSNGVRRPPRASSAVWRTVDDLSEVFACRRWMRADWPFTHVVARDVFTRDFYRELETEVRDLLALGLSETPRDKGFSRNIRGYDAYGATLPQIRHAPSTIFISPAWRDMLCALHGIAATPYVFAGAHHHPPASPSGLIHNDFNPAWFPRAPDDRMQTPDQYRCSYTTGEGELPAAQKIQVARAAVAIFFVANENLRAGDGGETGVYRSGAQTPRPPDGAWPPTNNTLVTFECTPHSFHRFLTNRRVPRTSIIMWTHCNVEDALKRFGVDSLESFGS
jgi:2OG-Fe(II) oxygenase superfamily